jgi:DNA-directed RNA polymerase II subunit RPB2
MIKLDNEGKEALKVEVYVGGKENKIYVDRPTVLDTEGKSILLTPYEARLRNITYNTKLYADIEVVYTKEGEHYATKIFNNTLLGNIPLMLHSDQCILYGQGSKVLRALSECQMDSGGYFIIDGKEKVIVSQERVTTNRLFVEKINDPDILFRGRIRCTGTSGETALAPRTVEIIYINPAPKQKTKENKSKNDDDEENNEEEDIKTNSYKSVRGGIFVSLPSIQGIIPLTTVFRALGFETDKSIIEAICGDYKNTHYSILNILRPSLVHGSTTQIYSIDEAHQNLKPRTYFKSVQQVKSILVMDLFPHIEHNIREKGMYLGYLVNILIKTILGITTVSDRDSYAFKRVDISGYQLAQLFQEIYSKYRKQIRNILDKEYNTSPVQTTGKLEELIHKNNLHRIFSPAYITDYFIRSLKGAWGTSVDDPEQGKVQDLSRLSYIGFLSHLRRVNNPLDRSIKLSSPHRLHSQQWGIMCPFETPDGGSVGYLKNMALLTQITAGTLATTLYPLLDELDIITINKISINSGMNNDNIKVIINGSWYGITTKPHLVVDTIRLYRRNGLINQFISVAWNIQENEIRIQTEAGRPCRPLLIVKDSKPLLASLKPKTWYDMIYGSALSNDEKTESKYYEDKYISPYTLSEYNNKDAVEILKSLTESQGCIEFLDIEEENTMFIAMKLDKLNSFHTHLEINPATIFSVVTQIVPLANSNQAPRIQFHGSQSKQAIGIYTTNFNKRFDTMGYIQHYPQKRIVSTRGSHFNGNDKMPNGCQVVVAIMTYSGFNQEDGIMINKTSIDRGLFQITAYKSLTAIEKTLSPNDTLRFANPITMRDNGIKVDNIKHSNYTLINENGFISEEAYIPRGQEATVLGMVHVQKTVKQVSNGVLADQVIEESYKDVSLTTDVHHYGRIDKVFVGEQVPGNPARICKVRFRKIRRPELGDKHCLTPEHEVLTNEGWKYINEITIKDEVCALAEDGSIKYENPYKLYEVECNNDELYKLESQQVDLCVTMDHNMWVRKRNSNEYERIKAIDVIGKRVSYLKTGKNINEDYQLILPAVGKCSEKILNMEYFLEFFGYWISDGWARISKRQRINRKSETIDYIVEIAQVKEVDRIRLIELIKLLGYTPTNHGTHMIQIASRQLCEFLEPLSVGAPNKYLPEWVWKLSVKQARQLYEGLRRGDGTVTKSGSDIYYTSSYKLANDIQRLALHAEWSGNIRKVRNAGYTSYIGERAIVQKYDSYSVNIVKSKNNPTINHSNVNKQNGQKEEIIKYTGKVYCIELPSHVFYVRKNGKPVWTGNCSAHGQKGVVGMIIPQENMPFTKDGIVPDIIINPHALPSRMTIAHLVETIFCKLCCLEGNIGDGTVFIPLDKDVIYDSLENNGYEKYGNEILYNGFTGHQIHTEIFMGPIFYYRLKHMVADKIHSRSTGPKTQITHQPTSGRSKDGGLRLGEMERDVLLSHGLSQFIKESMMERSDKFKWGVCRYCGTLAKFAPKRNILECNNCNRDDILTIETPYAWKLLIQEMESMCVQMRLSKDEVIEEFSDDESESETESLPRPEVIEEEISDDSESEMSSSESVGEELDTEEQSGGGTDEQINVNEGYEAVKIATPIITDISPELDLNADISEGNSVTSQTPIASLPLPQIEEKLLIEQTPQLPQGLVALQQTPIVQPPTQTAGSDVKVIDIPDYGGLPEPKEGGGDEQDEQEDDDGEFFA